MKIKLTDSSRSKKDRLIDYSTNFVVIIIMMSILLYIDSCPCAFHIQECCRCPQPIFPEQINNTYNVNLTFLMNMSDYLNFSEIQDICPLNASALRNNP